MSSLSDVLGAAFLVSLAADVVLSITYLVLAGRRARGGLPDGDWDREVRFHAIWGMMLAVPALLFVVSGASEMGSWTVWTGLMLVVLIGLYAVPALAIAGRGLAPALRWYPAVVAIGTLPLLVIVGAFADGFGSLWLVIFLPASTRLGIGYAADCMVGVRFARAVGRRDAARLASILRADHRAVTVSAPSEAVAQ